MRRLRIHLSGAVQGVGFRPFVYRLADELHLAGWIRNTSDGLVCEVEGRAVQQFTERLRSDAPAPARIDRLDTREVALLDSAGFRILDSEDQDDSAAWIQPDLATCPACLAEIEDPANRRFRHPFTNCTLCGPRFSIVERVPYDRRNTTMRGFPMCAACAAEYQDPADRRFHAQPIACPECGPQLWLSHANGERLAERDDALQQTVAAIRGGKIVAVKGIGGFHLISSLETAARLRERKQRGNKPFALMYPNLATVDRDGELGERERELLQSSAAPIVLVAKRTGHRIPAAIAPGNPRVGVLLPYSPVHHLLLRELGEPVIATSGNLSEEPICFENDAARRELNDIADLFLLHDRPIQRPVDDSVVTVVAGREMVLRRSRGYAPLPVDGGPITGNVLAVGADLKNTVTWLRRGKAFISQHLGDLGTERSLDAHEAIKRDLPGLYPDTAIAIAHDRHPDYFSTRSSARDQRVPVQHHHAHIVAVLAEHGLMGEVLGVAFDGTGYGPDGTIWGGEFLLADRRGFERVNWLLPFPLIGGEWAAKNPRLPAAAMLHLAGLPLEGLAREEEQLLGLNHSLTSSVGRLFDGVSALLGLGARNSFEGEAAMALEFACADAESRGSFPLPAGCPIDWRPMLQTLLAERNKGTGTGILALRFHRWLVDAIARVASEQERKTVVLAGGCFQNRVLLELTIQRLLREGFEVFWPQQIPPNDGGISLGQAVIAGASNHEQTKNT